LPLGHRPEFSAETAAATDTGQSESVEARMTEVYFHYSNAPGVLVDQGGASVSSLAEARDYAELIMRSLISTPSPEDWRSWVLHVSDDLDDEVVAVPFASMVGKPN
jgi:hypothetical protein